MIACSCGYKEKGLSDKPEIISVLPESAEIITEEEGEYFNSSAELLSCNYFDDGFFISYDNRAAEYPSDKRIIGGVVPHHLTAGHLISGFFKAAEKSRTDVETVVIIATSHNEGNSGFYTTFSDWSSPFGVVETNREISSHFLRELGAEEDDKRLETDHSASSHIPFVKKYFPEAKTACLLVAPSRDRSVPERLANALYSVPDKDKCLFLFSVDFSHYLSDYEADRADEITSRAVAERDYERIESFTNDNVDSPICLSAYIRLSELFGGEITEADNCNTADVLGIPYNDKYYSDGVTSYFVFLTETT